MDEPSGNDVVLDGFVAADARTLCEVDGDPEHQRRFDFPADFTPSVQHAAEVIARWERERAAGERFPFAVRNAAGDLVGGCELTPLGDGAANVSYWTHPRHRGRGIASAAVRRICARAFDEFGFRAVELVVDADNLASRRVAERNGFTEVGVRDGRVLYVLEARAPRR